VDRFLRLRAKCDQIIEKCFQGDKHCQKKMKEAFEETINKDTRGTNLCCRVDTYCLMNGVYWNLV
jgi:hypothetical protein